MHESYTLKRQQGLKRVGRGAQEWCTRIAEFADVYSEIFEYVSQLGGIYGQIGYQTISILFFVSKRSPLKWTTFMVANTSKIVGNKSANDKKFFELLAQFRSSFPRLGIMKEIYPGIKPLFLCAYTRLINFSRAVAEYFAKSWSKCVSYSPSCSSSLKPALERTFIAITGSTAITELASEVDKAVAEINSECMVRLHGRLQRSELLLEDIARQNQEMRELLERLDSENYDNRIRTLRQLLLVILPIHPLGFNCLTEAH